MGKEDLLKSLNIELDKVDKAIKSQPKELVLILQAHLFAENIIDEIICAVLKRGDIIVSSNLAFYQKLLIVQASDILKPHLIDVLKQLNKYRNKASHELQYKLTEKDIDLIGLPFGEYYIKCKREHKDIDSRLRWIIYTLVARLHNSTYKQ